MAVCEVWWIWQFDTDLKYSTGVWRLMRQNKQSWAAVKLKSFILIVFHLVIHTYIIEIPGTTTPWKQPAFLVGWKLKTKERLAEMET